MTSPARTRKGATPRAGTGSERMPHLERAAVAALVVLVGSLLVLSLYWTGEVTREVRAGGELVRAEEAEAPVWDLSRPLPEPTPLGPQEALPPMTIPLATPAAPGGSSPGPAYDAGLAEGERTYEIRDGDRLETIALRETGSRKNLPAILRANPGLEPQRLRIGQTIRIPRLAGETPVEGKPESKPLPDSPQGPAPAARTYAVKRGDTLWSISTRLLGDGKRWREIVERNPSVFGGGRELPERAVLEIP